MGTGLEFFVFQFVGAELPMGAGALGGELRDVYARPAVEP